MNTFDLRKFLFENKLTKVSKLKEQSEEEELKDLLRKDYETFVRELGDNIKDPKFRQAIKQFADNQPIKTTTLTPEVTELLPTQNEIDADKSLHYPLTIPSQLEGILKGGIQAPGGNAIVTGGKGKFIIDGHHRWSQVYVINPKAKIKALDIINVTSPSSGLKAAQLGIAADIGKIPTQSVQGTNMITMSKQELYNFVKGKVTPECVDVFIKFKIASSSKDLDGIVNYIWKNVELMQKNNKPVQGAPKRDIMPQTDTAPNWQDDAPGI